MEGFACLEKQEKLVKFELGDIKIKELVFSDANPFPGYYSETPGNSMATKPKYVFIAMKQEEGCYEDNVLRATYNIKKTVKYNFDANYGRISMHNKTKPCIRIKIDEFSKVPELIECFKNEGIEFQSTEKFTAFNCLIRIRKYMVFTNYVNGIFSGEKQDHYYIQVPEKLKWEKFAKIIISIKGSGNFGVFDAAQTSLYLKEKIIEFVRIYTKSFVEADFTKLKDEILKRLK